MPIITEYLLNRLLILKGSKCYLFFFLFLFSQKMTKNIEKSNSCVKFSVIKQVDCFPFYETVFHFIKGNVYDNVFTLSIWTDQTATHPPSSFSTHQHVVKWTFKFQDKYSKELRYP